MYDEQFSQYKAEIAYEAYRADPKAWTEKADKHSRAVWFGFTVLYVGLAAIALIFLFPSTLEINLWLKSERLQFWLPIYCGGLGLALYLLKVNFLLAFGATELAFSAASAYSFRNHVISDGIASWAAGVAVVYLFAKGFENSHKGLISATSRKTPDAAVMDAPKSAA